MSKGRSVAGAAAVPYFPRSKHIEAAKHLRLTVTRYIADRATLNDIHEAVTMLVSEAPVRGESGYRTNEMSTDAVIDGHAPRYQYDCDRCKFHWCCGPTCQCMLNRDGLPDPPRKRQDEVDDALVKLGYAPQFHGPGAQRR